MFWGYPTPSWLPIQLSHVGSQVRRRQSQSYKFKEFAKMSIFQILKQTLHTTHLLKLLDKMFKYEMDPMSIFEDTERTRFCPHTDRQTDGQTRWNQYTPFNFVEQRYKNRRKLAYTKGYKNRRKLAYTNDHFKCSLIVLFFFLISM